MLNQKPPLSSTLTKEKALNLTYEMEKHDDNDYRAIIHDNKRGSLGATTNATTPCMR